VTRQHVGRRRGADPDLHTYYTNVVVSALEAKALSCGLHPLARVSLTSGAYLGEVVPSPGLLTLTFSDEATGPSSLVTGGEDGGSVESLVGFEPLRHVHVYDLPTGAFGVEIESIVSGPAQVAPRVITMPAMDACQGDVLDLAAGTTIRWRLSATGILREASAIHVRLAAPASLRVASPSASGTYLCDARTRLGAFRRDSEE